MRIRGYIGKSNAKGQSLVEFALVLPLLLLLIFGLIQFGIIFSSYITVTTAVREGARIAVVEEDEEIIKGRVINSIGSNTFLNPITLDDIDVEYLIVTEEGNYLDGGSREQGGPVRVAVEASTRIIVPFLDYLVGNSFPVNSRSIMRVEYAKSS